MAEFVHGLRSSCTSLVCSEQLKQEGWRHERSSEFCVSGFPAFSQNSPPKILEKDLSQEAVSLHVVDFLLLLRCAGS